MRGFLFGLGIALSGCAAKPSAIGADTADELAGRIAGQPQSCVSIEPTSSLRVIDPATLGYGNGRTIYVSRLRARCSGLTALSTIVLDARGTQYCRGDHFRAAETGAVVLGPICVLGPWVPYRQP